MPTFHDPRLQEALEITAPHIEGLNAISEDIKALESYLSEKKVQVVIAYELNECLGGLFAGALIGGERLEGESEHLVLAPNGKRWRLMYKRCCLEGYFEEHADPPWIWTVAHIEESRPLIETKTKVRIRAYKLLPEFLKEVARHFAVDPAKLDEKPLTEEDIPF